MIGRQAICPLAAAAALLTGSAAAAAPAAATLSITDDDPASTAKPVTVTGEQAERWLSLGSTAAQTATLTVAPLMALGERRTCSGGQGCTATWSLLARPTADGAMKAQPLTPDTDYPVEVSPDRQVQLRLSATLPKIGSYGTFLIARLPGGKDQRLDLRIDRVAPTAPAGFLKLGSPDPVTIGNVVRIPGWVTNTTAAKMNVPLPKIHGVLRGDGQGTTPVTFSEAGKAVVGKGGSSCNATAQPSKAEPLLEIDVKDSQQLWLCLDALPGPGTYTARVGVPGLIDESSAMTVSFSLRRPWLYAVLFMVAGAIIAGLLRGWWDVGRPVHEQLRLVAAAEARLRRLGGAARQAPPATRLEPLIASAQERLSELWTRLYSGASTSEQDAITAAQTRNDRLQALLAVEKMFLATDSPAGAQNARQEAIDAFEADPYHAGLSTKIDDYRAAVRDALRTAPPAARGAAAAAAGPQRTIFDRMRLVGPGASEERIQAAINRADDISYLVVIAIAVWAGTHVLWLADPDWGSPQDYLVAFFWGAGLTAAGKSLLDALIGRYGGMASWRPS